MNMRDVTVSLPGQLRCCTTKFLEGLDLICVNFVDEAEATACRSVNHTTGLAER